MAGISRADTDAAARELATRAGAGLQVGRRLGLLGRTPEAWQIGEVRAWLGPFRPCDTEQGVAFTWSAPAVERWRWAEVKTIPPKGSRHRVVYLGESVARGFFFDPASTPARMLEATLREARGEEVEVIDLAANDLAAEELLALLEGVPALEPDAIVVFAGNNWTRRGRRAHVQDLHDRPRAAAAVRASGVRALERHFERALAADVTVLVEHLGRKLKAFGIDVVVLVPEWNLLDWRSEPDLAAPWLAGDGNRCWWRSAARLERSPPGSPRARELARAMVKLDGASTGDPLRVLASEDVRRGRALLERARDARLWELADQPPRCPAIVQNALRGLAGGSVRVIDLPALFARESGGGLPGRRFFLDYCHLSLEGLCIATRATAKALRGGRSRSGPRVPEDALPSQACEAMAHFAAAVHNAHWGQPPEIVGHHLDRALALSPGSQVWIERFVEMQGRPAPPLLTGEAAGFLREEEDQLARFFLRYGLRRELDHRLVAAMLERLPREPSLPRRVRARRGAEWGVRPGRTVDLLATVFLPRHSALSWPRETRAWFRATRPRSVFAVPVASRSALLIEITARKGGFVRGGARAHVRFNGQPIGQLRLGATWEPAVLHVPAKLVRDGDENELVLEWLACSWDGGAALAAAAEETLAGRAFETIPAFAEVHSLVARNKRSR